MCFPCICSHSHIQELSPHSLTLAVAQVFAVTLRPECKSARSTSCVHTFAYVRPYILGERNSVGMFVWVSRVKQWTAQKLSTMHQNYGTGSYSTSSHFTLLLSSPPHLTPPSLSHHWCAYWCFNHCGSHCLQRQSCCMSWHVAHACNTLHPWHRAHCTLRLWWRGELRVYNKIRNVIGSSLVCQHCCSSQKIKRWTYSLTHFRVIGWQWMERGLHGERTQGKERPRIPCWAGQQVGKEEGKGMYCFFSNLHPHHPSYCLCSFFLCHIAW